LAELLQTTLPGVRLQLPLLLDLGLQARRSHVLRLQLHRLLREGGAGSGLPHLRLVDVSTGVGGPVLKEKKRSSSPVPRGERLICVYSSKLLHQN
jgi:hypothetical protein